MHSHYKKTTGLTVFLLLCALKIGCSNPTPQDSKWEMLALGLPKEIKPKVATFNMGYYALKQTHRPLFELGEDGQYYSQILSKWERSADSKTFLFCLENAINFSPEIPFTTKTLESHLVKTFSDSKLTFEPTKNKDCVSFSTHADGTKIIPFLSRMENAPSIPSEIPNADLGLGDFRVTKISDKLIHFTRKSPKPLGFNEIEMLEYLGPQDPNLQNQNIEDFNRVYFEDLPSWIKTKYQSTEALVLQSIGLLIDHPDANVRKTIYNCVEIDNFRRSFMAGRTRFKDIANFLPLGVEGSKAGRPTQDDGFNCKTQKNSSLIFANTKSGNSKTITEYIESLKSKTGIQISISNLSESEYGDKLFKSPRPFNLSVVALDAVEPDLLAFLGPLIGAPLGILDTQLTETRTLYNTLIGEKNSETKNKITKEIIKSVEKNGVFLPLFQEERVFYYPKRIKQFDLGLNFLEYPEVSRFSL